MASTFSLTSESYQGRYMKLYCEQEVDIATNKSTIKWTLSSLGGTSNYYQTGPTTVTIARKQVYYCALMTWDTKQFPAAKGSVSGTLTVDHDVYGDKTIYVSMSTSIYTGVVKTYSGNWTLDNIPRGASVTNAPDFYDTQIPTVTYSNPAGNNVDALDICISDNTGVELYTPYRSINKTGSSYTFTADDINSLKNITGNSLKLWFLIRTKIGSTYFDSHAEKTFTMTENSDTKPVVSMSISLNNGTLPSAFNGLYIQGVSRVNVRLSAEGRYNSVVKSYSAKVDDTTYNSDKFTSDAIQNSGSVNIFGYAKDSRGFTGSVSQQIQVIPYSKPLVVPLGDENAILCYRSDGNGKRTGNSTSVWIKAKMTYFPVSSSGDQKNFCALQWRRKIATEEWNPAEHLWSDLIPRTDITSNEYNALITDAEFILTKAYTIQIRAIDDIGLQDVKTFDVPTQDVALHLGSGGKNAAIGAYCDYSEDYRLDIGWKTYFHEAVNMGGNQITGIANPVNSSDAVPLGYAQNAFSPAAYGFGNFAPIPLDADLNDYYNPGAYGIQSNEIANSISNIPEAKAGILYIVNAAGMNTIAGTWKYARQIYIPYSETGRYYARTLYKGSTEEWIFDEWEVNNPPMAVGVEYRTTERFMGKPVYAKLVSLGAAPNAAYKTVSGCYSGAKYVISCTGIASQSTGYQLSLPTFDNAGKGIGLWAYANGNIAICANYNASAYTICYALVKYIKN